MTPTRPRNPARLAGRKRTSLALTLIALCLPTAGYADESTPVVVEGGGGKAIYIDEDHKRRNDGYGYAGAVRAGNFIYVSGVVVGAWNENALDSDGLKQAIRNAMEFARQKLVAAGTDFDHVVDITSFHVWDSAYFDGDKTEHMDAIVAVKREFMQGRNPAWTAIGTTGLIPDRGIIEIRLIAHAPEAQ